MLDQITPLILTYNEAPNIARTLGKLNWARRIVVVDSGSTDPTVAIAQRLPGVDVIQRTFDNHGDQWNFGLDQVRSEWVLSLDADYELSDQLVSELSSLNHDEAVSGYRASFVYRVHGRDLRGTLYPPRIVLHRSRRSRYLNRGHTQKLQIAGSVKELRGVIYHDDRKPLARWFESQRKYCALEAAYLIETDRVFLSRSDRIRRLAWPAPLLVFFYVLLAKRCLFDGWPGWFYAWQRLLAEAMIALEVIEQKSSATQGSATLRAQDNEKPTMRPSSTTMRVAASAKPGISGSSGQDQQ